MPTILSRLIRHLKTDLACDGDDASDGTLLERFLSRQDGSAFALLVRRHGPMVLGVCRRLLGNVHDAEDAFQATFLVAVRRAGSVRPRELFGNWLYGVAYRTALEVRSRIARRRTKERQVDAMPQPPQPEAPADGDELRQLLDRELSRLPEKYRVPVVLCELEGRSRRAVAQHLGLPEGTLSSRLATARKRLARRLSRHGAVLSTGALAAVLADEASAGVPAGLTRLAIEGAIRIATGQATLAAVASPHVVALTEGVLKAMLLTKLKVAGLFVLAVAALVAGAGVTGYRALADDPPVRRQAEPAADDKPKTRDKARAAAGDEKIIRGSGKEVTQELKIADFTSVNVESIFHVEVTQGKAFRVAVTTDDNVVSHIKVAKDGSALKVGLTDGTHNFENVTLKAVITMPTLEGLNVTGAGHATITGFKSDKDCKLRANGAGHLKGDLQAGSLDLEASGAGHITMKGSAKKARLVGEGASHLDLADFTVDQANITLTGASGAKVKVKDQLDYNVSGASHLKYAGDPKIGKKQASGAASAGKLQK
jgi:RNA polymerase sigma factor (sigma-70 family)